MELTKNEYAAIKRIATTVKTLNSKKNTLLSKIGLMELEIKRIEKEIDNWELPVKNMTGGFTSDQVLDGTWRLAPKNEDVEYYREEDIELY
jgi:hypothetical protein